MNIFLVFMSLISIVAFLIDFPPFAVCSSGILSLGLGSSFLPERGRRRNRCPLAAQHVLTHLLLSPAIVDRVLRPPSQLFPASGYFRTSPVRVCGVSPPLFGSLGNGRRRRRGETRPHYFLLSRFHSFVLEDHARQYWRLLRCSRPLGLRPSVLFRGNEGALRESSIVDLRAVASRGLLPLGECIAEVGNRTQSPSVHIRGARNPSLLPYIVQLLGLTRHLVRRPA